MKNREILSKKYVNFSVINNNKNKTIRQNKYQKKIQWIFVK